MKSSDVVIKFLNNLCIESSRLTIKKFSLAEVDFNVEDEMNPLLMKYIKSIQTLEVTTTKSEELAGSWSGDENTWVAGAIRLKESNSYIGLVCLRYQSVQDEIVEIGWRLRQKYHMKGYATEAATTLVNYVSGMLMANKIMAYCDNDNEASIRVMKKLGMKREGLLVRHFRINNEWKDEGIFSLVVKNNVD